MRKCRLAKAAIGLMFLLAGCSRMPLGRPPVYPVSGEVFVHGQPATNAVVRFYAIDNPIFERLCPHAIVEPDGSFRLTTFNSEDGAPVGSYAVTLTWPLPPRPGNEEGPDRFHGRYNDRRRPVCKVQVFPGENQLERINLP
ncbi:MAG TPA: hypothetical protein VG099_10655 [Gemmataceae bacterium]|nr:hypothetical protein [Gemmataceae bacterium]